jgi:prevent-host-death family protein
MPKARQRTIPAGEFKDRCLRIMEEVSRQGIAVTVTKRGKPLVRVVPAHVGGGLLMAVVLDTCAWLWACAEPAKLSRAAKEAIERERKRDGLIVSVFSVWEIAKLVQKGKLSFSIPCRRWLESAIAEDGVSLHPLTPEICIESTELPGTFGGDPADQIIVATARLLSAPVVTRDRRILDYAHVPTIW